MSELVFTWGIENVWTGERTGEREHEFRVPLTRLLATVIQGAIVLARAEYEANPSRAQWWVRVIELGELPYPSDEVRALRPEVQVWFTSRGTIVRVAVANMGEQSDALAGDMLRLIEEHACWPHSATALPDEYESPVSTYVTRC